MEVKHLQNVENIKRIAKLHAILRLPRKCIVPTAIHVSGSSKSTAKLLPFSSKKYDIIVKLKAIGLLQFEIYKFIENLTKK